MKRQTVFKMVVTAAVLLTVAYGANAFAGRGGGYGYGGCWGAAGEDGAPLNAEQFKQMDAERQAFFDATADLRQSMYQKEIELRTELAKDAPDAAKAAQLQRELSKLEAEFEGKQLDHMLKMRQINPNAGRGYFAGGGRGPGSGNCRGAGGGGSPRCW